METGTTNPLSKHMNKTQAKIFVYMCIFFGLFFLFVATIPGKTLVLIPQANAEMSMPIPEIVAPVKPYTETTAIVTAYTAVEIACQPQNCIMANGKPAQRGFVACPRKLSLGTIVEIGGVEYECGDRTALWVEKKYGPTFDIFFGYDEISHQNALLFGRKSLEVKIYESSVS
jgi:hypothetical protein